MFYKGEIEDEIRDEKHPHRVNWVTHNAGEIDVLMESVVNEQSGELYCHHPSTHCSARGTHACCQI